MLEFDGTKLKQLRRAKGWTQGELGLMVGKKTEHISSYENGYAGPPLPVFLELVRIFEIQPEGLCSSGKSLELAA